MRRSPRDQLTLESGEVVGEGVGDAFVAGCFVVPAAGSCDTVRRFARASSPDELLVHAGTGQRPKTLEAYDSYLRRRWAEGCTNAEHLCRELRSLGYRGGGTAVRQYVRPWRAGLQPAAPSPKLPTVRQAVGWFLRNPAHLDPDEQHRLDALTAAGRAAHPRPRLRRNDGSPPGPASGDVDHRSARG